MPTAEQLLKEKISILEKSPETFTNSVDKIQLRLLKEAIKLTEKLELDGNKIRVSLKNIALIEEINQKLEGALTKGEYFKSVQALLADMDQAAVLTNKFMEKTIDNFEKSKLADAVYKLQRTKAAELLIGKSSMDSNFLQPVKNTILDAVTQETTLQQLVKNMNNVIIGDKNEGKLLRYTKTIAKEVLNRTDRVYSNTLAVELGLQFGRYTGGLIDTSRCFCEARNGKIFHIKEIQSWASKSGITDGFEGSADFDKAKECGFPWDGYDESTNSNNIKDILGGWGCDHFIAWMSLISVPKAVLNRAISKGYFKPTDKQKNLLNL